MQMAHINNALSAAQNDDSQNYQLVDDEEVEEEETSIELRVNGEDAHR